MTLRDTVRRLRTTHEQGFLAEAERQLAEVLVKQGKLAEAERLVNEAQRRVGRGDAWTRASLLHALGVVRAAQGRTDEAETAFADALAIIEPTMYTILTNGLRAQVVPRQDYSPDAALNALIAAEDHRLHARTPTFDAEQDQLAAVRYATSTSHFEGSGSVEGSLR